MIQTIYISISFAVNDIEFYIIMHYEIEHIAKTLKAARESKGLSQRALGRKAGVLQTQISKFENGAVDLRLSSLIALARVLDLELALVPRKVTPVVQSIIKSSERPAATRSDEQRRTQNALANLQKTLANVIELQPNVTELAQLARYARDFERLQIALPDPKLFQNANKAIEQFKKDSVNLNKIRDSLAQFESLRNELAHSYIDPEAIKPIRPAYNLDEDDGDG